MSADSGDVGVGFIGSLDRFTGDVRDFRGVFFAEVGLFAGAADVVGAVYNRLHPAEAGVARGADLVFGVGDGGERDERVAAFVEGEGMVGDAGADDFVLVGNVGVAFWNITGGRGGR